MAKKKKPCLVCEVAPSSSQICKEVQKPCCGRGPGNFSFLDECSIYIYIYIYIHTAVCRNFKPPRYINIYWRYLLVW